jgi:hypothetical protein
VLQKTLDPDDGSDSGYQYVAKTIIQGDAVGIPRSASTLKESCTG